MGLLPDRSRCSSNGMNTPFISFGELHGKHFDAENKKSVPKREVLGTAKNKIPSQKSLSSENLLKNAQMYGIITIGRRLSDCIGVLLHFCAELSYSSTVARLFFIIHQNPIFVNRFCENKAPSDQSVNCDLVFLKMREDRTTTAAL